MGPFCHHPTRRPDCGFCDRYYDDEENRRRVDHAFAAASARPDLVQVRANGSRIGLTLIRPKCEFEGEVAEPCTDARCSIRAVNHIRWCEHPEALWDRCKRGPVPDGSDVRSCSTCLLHAQAPPAAP